MPDAQGANTPATIPQSVATWRKVVAAILDFFTIFFVGGYAIARMTGNTNDGGFNLQGAPALMLIVLIAAYFFLGRKYLGGTFWQRILGAR